MNEWLELTEVGRTRYLERISSKLSGSLTLREWDQGFLEDMQMRLLQSAKAVPLSQKQLQQLERILDDDHERDIRQGHDNEYPYEHEGGVPYYVRRGWVIMKRKRYR